ncbi:hypothetical protein BLA29_014903, partial [Euroglyphus maynei]
GDKVVQLPIPTWNGKDEHLKFRINDKINKLRFDCIQHQQDSVGGRKTVVGRRSRETYYIRMGCLRFVKID